MEIVILSGAQIDLLSTYEKHGESFHDKLESTLTLIRTNPEIGTVFEGNYRRKLVRRSTFGVYYTVEGGRVMVSAILDQRQDPARIRERLGIR